MLSGQGARFTTSFSHRSRFWSALRCLTLSQAESLKAARSAKCSVMPSGDLCCWSRLVFSSFHSFTPDNFTFEDTLSQIGLGYTFLFLLGFKSPRWQWTALGMILFGYWLAWALYPAPGPGFDYRAVGVPQNWPHNFSGFASHWNKNSNLGNAFDQWFLNLLPRVRPFVFNGGGYLTLSFIPTLGIMILGLIAGRWLREAAPRIPFRKLLVAGAIGIAAGSLLHFTGICPVVKRNRTPAWTLFSGGACFRCSQPLPGSSMSGNGEPGRFL